MDKFSRTCIGLTLLVLSGSVSAIIIDNNIDADSLSGSEYVTTGSGLTLYDLLSSDVPPETDEERTLLNQAKRWARAIDNLLLLEQDGGLDAQQKQMLDAAPERLRAYLEKLELIRGGLTREQPEESIDQLLNQVVDAKVIEPKEIPTPRSETGTAENGHYESVPEPSTIALLGLGLLGIGAVRRLKKTV